MIVAKDGRLILRCLSLSYIGILVILPIFALISIVFKNNQAAIWAHITHPHAIYSLKITFFYALCIAIINCITGTATAWVLVRYDFPLKKTMNTLIDLPFAIPTVVTGIMLVTLYGPQSIIGHFFARNGFHIIYNQPGIMLALLFVTFPFVVRAVQPVIIEMEKEMEEAAEALGASPWTIFLKIILPTLSPAILTGTALSFSRALGEFGSIVIVAGNIPMKTQVASVYIYGEVESGNIPGALGISLVLLLLSFSIILLLNIIQKWKRKYEEAK
ncbi:MAG: sulfate ABC transporter permease subunit CysT [Candidatus Aminicenantes bacterium]|nr:sulfate ABC transporter permease subunit CysT [Candidatus Aminicenantes bacterium]